MTASEHLLVVDDDPGIRSFLERYLAKHGYQVSLMSDGENIAEFLGGNAVDLVILDLMLPGKDGLQLTRDIRYQVDVPVIMLTAKGDDIDRIIGLEMGADDYLPKPFNPRELLARIRSVLKRAQARRQSVVEPEPAAEKKYSFGRWVLDPGRHELTSSRGEQHSLTHGEYALLLAFVTHPNRVLSRDQLLDITRDREFAPFDRSIDVQVSRLRRKIEDDPKRPGFITTVRGGGYLFDPSPAPTARAGPASPRPTACGSGATGASK